MEHFIDFDSLPFYKYNIGTFWLTKNIVTLVHQPMVRPTYARMLRDMLELIM